jgi:hypothetical protein
MPADEFARLAVNRETFAKHAASILTSVARVRALIAYE